jgi:hypothetical protein
MDSSQQLPAELRARTLTLASLAAALSVLVLLCGLYIWKKHLTPFIPIYQYRNELFSLLFA